MSRPLSTLGSLLVLVAVFGCSGGDDGSDGNRAPAFRDVPAAQSPEGELKRVVTGDRVRCRAWGIDPDIEEVYYSWELVQDVSGAPDPDAGTLLDADTAEVTWQVNRPTERMRVVCTISDAQGAAVTQSAGTFRPGIALTDFTVDSDTTLADATMPYVVQGDLRVSAGATLTLGPGVELQFRPDRESGTQWEKRTLIVEGELVTLGELQALVLMTGGFRTHPGNGEQQFRGIATLGAGRADLLYTRVEFADTGLRIQSPAATEVELCAFENGGTGILVANAAQTLLRGVALRDNSVGLQLNNSDLRIEGARFEFNSLYGIDVDSSSRPAILELEGVDFRSNLQAHLRLNAGGPNTITALVRQTNFFEQSGDTPAVTINSTCFSYSVDFRGNYWGPVSDGQDIKDRFSGGQACTPSILDWSDADCAGDPEACDWSAVPW